MGATFISETLPGNLSSAQVRSRYREMQKQARHEYGHNPYNGTFSTCGQIGITIHKFLDIDQAENWLADNTDKRQVKAVRALSPSGDEVWVIGGWAAE